MPKTMMTCGSSSLTRTAPTVVRPRNVVKPVIDLTSPRAPQGLDLLTAALDKAEKEHYRFACPYYKFDEKQSHLNNKCCAKCMCFVCDVPMQKCRSKHSHVNAKDNERWKVKKFWSKRKLIESVASTKEDMILWMKMNKMSPGNLYRSTACMDYSERGIIKRLIALDACRCKYNSISYALWMQTYCLAVTRMDRKKPHYSLTMTILRRLIPHLQNSYGTVPAFLTSTIYPEERLKDINKLQKVFYSLAKVLEHRCSAFERYFTMEYCCKIGDKAFLKQVKADKKISAQILKYCRSVEQRTEMHKNLAERRQMRRAMFKLTLYNGHKKCQGFLMGYCAFCPLSNSNLLDRAKRVRKILNEWNALDTHFADPNPNQKKWQANTSLGFRLSFLNPF